MDKIRLQVLAYKMKPFEIDLTLDNFTNSKNNNQISVSFKNSDNNNFYTNNIYTHLTYKLQLIEVQDSNSINIKKIKSSELYINNKFICEADSENVFILENRVFNEYFGIVNLIIKINYNQEVKYYKSENLYVKFKNDQETSDSIDNMIEYISEYNYLIENFNSYSNKKVELGLGGYNSDNKLFALLNNIALKYQQNYDWFKINGKKSIYENIELKDFDKVSFIHKNTLDNIIKYPEFLIEAKEGISFTDNNNNILYNNKKFKPNKIFTPVINYNNLSYENKILLSFLNTVNNFVKLQKNNISKKQKEIIQELLISETKGFTSYRQKLLKITKKELDYKDYKINKLIKKFNDLIINYNFLFKFDCEIIDTFPTMTKTFEYIKEYREIYILINDWFNMSKILSSNEAINLYLSESSQVYEYYLLLKIINNFYSNGYECIEKSTQEYLVSSNSYYKNLPFNNTFIFKKGDKKKTLFYQPVINNTSYALKNAINLYRGIMLDDELQICPYYTPDYIIKTNNINDENETYVIIDAKFQSTENFIKYSIKDLVFKYNFSITPISEKYKISKISIICGKDYKQDEIKKYDNIKNPINNIFNKLKLEILPINPLNETSHNQHKNRLDRLL